MNDSNQDPNKPRSEPVFKPSPKLLSIRNKAPSLGLPNPATAATQFQTRRIEAPAPRPQSEDKGPKFAPNPDKGRKRDQSYDASNEPGMEEEAEHGRSNKRKLQKNLLTAPTEKKGEKTLGGVSKQRINTSTDRVAYGGQRQLKNYNQGQKKENDIFGNTLENIDVYKGKKLLFPIDVKIKTAETQDEVKPINMILEKQEAKDIEQKKGRTIMETLLDEFCFFQLPVNLPLEGCAQPTPKTDNADMEINTEDLLSSFLNHKFDSTGFHLERDFKVLTGNIKEKMIEEKFEKKGKVAEDKLYETYHIGKLCRMKNGQIKIKIGNNLFDVDEGVQDSFYKELFAIDYNEKIANSLFPIEKKFVIKPDMESFY